MIKAPVAAARNSLEGTPSTVGGGNLGLRTWDVSS